MIAAISDKGSQVQHVGNLAVGNTVSKSIEVGLPLAVSGINQVVSVNSEIQLDGSQSFDYLGRPLIYKWSVKEKPSSSKAALTNLPGAMPTFKADVPGIYTISLTVFNGVSNSLPSEVYVTANAGMNSNGIISLTLEKSSYHSGEKAELLGHILSHPENLEMEYFFESFVDGSRLLFNKSSKEANLLSGRTNALSSGVHTWSVQPYLQNRRKVSAMYSGIRSAEDEMLMLRRALKKETDSDKISRIQARLLVLESRIYLLEMKIQEERKPLGASIERLITVIP